MALHEVISIERKRTWSPQQKAQIVAEAMAPGANVRAIARHYDVDSSQVFRWRRQARLGLFGGHASASLPDPVVAEPTFAPVVVQPASPPVKPASRLPPQRAPEHEIVLSDAGRMVIALGTGLQITVYPDVDAKALARVVAALGGLA